MKPFHPVRVPALLAVCVVALFAGPGSAQPVNERALPKSDQMKPWFKDAKVGDFALYSKAGKTANEYTQRREVTAVSKDAVVVTTTILEGPKVPGGLDSRIAFTVRYTFSGTEPKPAEGVTLKSGKEKLKVGEKELECATVEAFKGDTPLSKLWYSDSVPVSGLVKSVNAKTKEEIVLVKHGRGK